MNVKKVDSGKKKKERKECCRDNNEKLCHNLMMP